MEVGEVFLIKLLGTERRGHGGGGSLFNKVWPYKSRLVLVVVLVLIVVRPLRVGLPQNYITSASHIVIDPSLRNIFKIAAIF